MSRHRHPETVALVLAAGQGTRMKSDLAKVLHPMAGQPLLAWVLETLDELGVGRVLVVVGHQRERIMALFADAGAEWVVQAEQCGTGHAVLMAGPVLEDFEGTLLVVCGDTPLLRADTLHRLLEEHAAHGAAVTVLSMRLPEPFGYGRIVRDPHGALAAIVEERDATPEQRRIDEVNSGVYAFDYPALARALGSLTIRNAQGEYYLTDTVAVMVREGLRAAVVCADDHRELLGINTVEQLAEAERV
ncbi:MAG TPA: NTP transferase domain-containing protein, partial [Terriglobales bacterium]|nr:NTP transferase domain-containing protein [Terriglobales bacterium]